jgi:hypothetical protein
MEVRMPDVAHQQDRDLAIWHAWVQGVNQAKLAEQYGVTQPAISQALARAKALLPVEALGLYLMRSLARLERLYGTFQPRADDGDKGAARIVLQTIAQEGRYLGLDSPAKLELYAAQDQVRSDHQRVDVRAELARLVADIHARSNDDAA